MKRRLNAALTAARWLGTKEGGREHREILAAYNAITPLPRGYRLSERDPWCAGFASAAAVMAGEGSRYPIECSCTKIIEKAKEMGIWVEQDAHVPNPGDWVLYDWQARGEGDCTGAPDHVGVVIGTEAGQILVVEGNYDNQVKLRKIPVNDEKIRGFVCPEWEEESAMRYRTLSEIPAFARKTIEKLIRDGSLAGYSEEDLGLSEEMIRIFVILDRRGKL